MRVLIKETNEIEIFELIDPKTEMKFILDFVKRAAGFIDFKKNEDEKIEADYILSRKTTSWWEETIGLHQKLEKKIEKYKEEQGADSVQKIMHEVRSNDFREQIERAIQALDEAFITKEDPEFKSCIFRIIYKSGHEEKHEIITDKGMDDAFKQMDYWLRNLQYPPKHWSAIIDFIGLIELKTYEAKKR